MIIYIIIIKIIKKILNKFCPYANIHLKKCKDPKIWWPKPTQNNGFYLPKPIKFVRDGKEQQQWVQPKDLYKGESPFYSATNEYEVLYRCSRGDWVCIKVVLFIFSSKSFSFCLFSNAPSFPYIPLPSSHLQHPFLPCLPPLLTLVTFHI